MIGGIMADHYTQNNVAVDSGFYEITENELEEGDMIYLMFNGIESHALIYIGDSSASPRSKSF